MDKRNEDGQNSVATSAFIKKMEIFDEIENSQICEFLKKQVSYVCDKYTEGIIPYRCFKETTDFLIGSFCEYIDEAIGGLNEGEVWEFVKRIIYDEIDENLGFAA